MLGRELFVGVYARRCMDLDLSTRRRRFLEHRSVIEEFGTPLYVFFEDDVRRNYRELRTLLDEQYPDSEIHFAAKANFTVEILSVLEEEGCGAEAFANCELTATLEAGFDPEDILLTGMYRPQAELEQAMNAGVTHFLLDNAAEFERVAAAADATGTSPRVLLRGNPAMSVPTDPDIATATRESKFGLDIESGRAMAVAERIVENDRLTLAGVQLHIGSQIEHAEPYATAAREMLEFAATIRDQTGVEIDILDLGGGFPVPYDGDVPDTRAIIGAIGDAVRDTCRELDLSRPTLFLEPGRRLVGNAGALCGSVGLVKETPASTFVVLDAGTNAVSSYWPYPIYSLTEGPATETYDVAGPLCYTGDVVQEGVSLPVLEEGDVVVVDRIGAYSLASASNTNAEPKPAVVLVDENGVAEVVRERETCSDVLGL
jgi:diaminopimelate decarboxylase